MAKTKKTKRVTGTREWAAKVANVANGCEHDCRYCYAKYDATKRYKTVDSSAWNTPSINHKALEKKWGKVSGTIMFPTTHDITPAILPECLIVLRNMLEAGNNVLIVSKPHKKCIEALCRDLDCFKSQILFRFTIGSDDDDILGYWEPNAPKFAERVFCLFYAKEKGFRASVSMEPMLDADNAVRIVNRLSPGITDCIWLGKMNKIPYRVEVKTDEDKRRLDAITAAQTDDKIKALYAALKDNPLVKWKDSIKEVMGIESPCEEGLDV